MWTAAQNDQIRATELKIINQPMAAPIGGYARAGSASDAS